MNPRIILSCFFAAYGIYLAFSGAFAAAAAVGSFMMGGVPQNEMRWLTYGQYAMWFLPALVGMALAIGASYFGAMAATMAGAKEAPVEFRLDGPELLSALLAALGIYLLITEAGQFARILFLMFQARAGSHAISEAAMQRMPDGTELIAHGVCAVGGYFLAKKCRFIASRLLPRQ